jgi:tRNA-dihydrouridine synthase
MNDQFEALRNGVVLAELGGHGDGPYCAQHGAGGALVVLGTYIVDPGENVPYPRHFVFKPGKRNYASYLNDHVAAARGSGAKVAVSIVTVEMKDTIEFLEACEDAGADYGSYCAYSGMEMFIRRGLSAALCERRNWQELRRWTSAMVKAVHIPIIIKMGLDEPQETADTIAVMADSGVPAVHICIHETSPGSEGLRSLPRLKGKCQCLIAGGGIADAAGARRVLDGGADAVAIATAAMKDPGLIGRIQKALRA